MKKVPIELIPALLKGAENQQVKPIDYTITATLPTKPVAIESCCYDKGHDVPGGAYIARLVSIKYHSKYYSKVEVQILGEAYTNQPYQGEPLIKGYTEKFCVDEGLYLSFGAGQRFDKPRHYVGRVGIIRLSATGWIDFTSTENMVKVFGCDLSPYRIAPLH